MGEQNRLLPDKPEHDRADSRDTEQEVAEKNAQQPDDSQGNLIPTDHSLLDQNSPGKSRPRISRFHIIRGKHTRRNAMAALIPLASLGLYLLYTVLPAAAATITIMPMKHELTQTSTFTTAPQNNLALHRVPGRQLTYTTSTKTQTVPVHSTGHRDGAFAHGDIVFSQPSTYQLPEGKPIAPPGISADFYQLTIHLASGRSLDETSLEPGQIHLGYTYPASANDSGTIGNLPADAIDGLYRIESTSGYYSDMYPTNPPPYPLRYSYPTVYISNPEPFTGGADAYDGPIVSLADTQSTENDFTTQLQQEAQHTFQSSLQPGEALLNNLKCTPTTQDEPPIGSPATSVTITEVLNCSVEAYDTTTTHAQMLQEIKQLATRSLDSHFTLLGPLQFTIVDPGLPGTSDTFVLNARSRWRLLLDQGGKQALQRALAGLSQDDARLTLQNRYTTRTVALDLSRWWGERLPLDPLAIQIVARYPPSS